MLSVNCLPNILVEIHIYGQKCELEAQDSGNTWMTFGGLKVEAFGENNKVDM